MDKENLAMNRHDLKLLQTATGYPALTITIPTHRAAPDNRQDPIRLRNLAAEASNRLLGEFSKRDIDPLLARLNQLVESIDHRSNLDGLALFVNHEFARAFSLPFPLKERIVVDEKFAVRDLVYVLNRSPRYWVLVLGEKPTRLYEATRETLIEITEGDFPLIHTGPGGEAPLPGGFGIKKSAYRDERHRQFFRQVDAALRPFLLDDPLPLAVVGVDRYRAFFSEVSAHKDAILASLGGSHSRTSSHRLGELVWPQAREALAEYRKKYLAELEQAIGEKKFASTIGEVRRMAHEGRGRLLLVEQDYHAPARIDESGLHLKKAHDANAPDVLDDAVDEVIKTVLEKQGQVVFVENGVLKQHQRIALTLRY
jgi:hypothetical protein